jgi:tetratricopeptide (TPR) repeat protein
MSRIGTGMAAAAAIAALLSGCHTCDDHDASQTAFELAKFNYENKKYDQAKTLYSRCVEMCSDNEEGWLGLANAAREFGNIQYQTAAELAGQGKIQDSKRVFKEATDSHVLAHDIFQRKIKDFPDDMAPHYGLGLFYYQRATSPVPFPFPLDDALRRGKDRDLAIAEFQRILKKGELVQVHRYLGLALFAAGRMDEGRPHLKRYHDIQQGVYEKILQSPGTTDEEKKRKESAMAMVTREIDDIRDVLSEHFMGVSREYDRLRLKRDRTKDEDAKMAKLKRESLELENVIKGFHLTNMGQVEMEVRRRCDDYLRVFNDGQVAEIMGFMAPKQGEEAAVQKAVQERVEQGTKFRKPQYRTIVVSGETASVGLICEVSSKKGTRPEAELTMHWRLVGGQWKVSELP